MEKEIVSEGKKKPVYDEQTLAKLLEAAYVLQEHNRRQREMASRSEEPTPSLSTAPELELPNAAPLTAEAIAAVQLPVPEQEAAKDDYTLTLAQIVETQHQIQMRHLELEEAMSLVAERVTEIAHAGGAGVGIVKGKKVGYRAVAGRMIVPQGTEVLLEKALCAASLRAGHVIRCTHVHADFLIDAEECRRRGIHSLIAVPIYHNGGIAGALELYYSDAAAFTEQDVHTCQLMAGLVTESLAKAEELSWKKSLADERAMMLEALEKLKPNLPALAEASTSSESAAGTSENKTANSVQMPQESTFACQRCGHKLAGEEQFCGKCGTPRSGDYEPLNLQSKVATLWHMQEARKKESSVTQEDGDRGQEGPLGSSTEQPISNPFGVHGILSEDPLESKKLSERLEQREQSDLQVADRGNPDVASRSGAQDIADDDEEASTKMEHAGAWSSAATARDFLEQLATQRGALSRVWNTRRGDVYLTIAIILVAFVTFWGVWSGRSVGASGTPSGAAHHKAAPDADLSLFDRMLISLGLADPPETPESKGNPTTQVWVDLQTALYYCPGADLYGKTPKGKFASQRDAQLDQFEPAARQACN
jgi:putative methionine-R-sulfoxide reductase with GAF domain